MVHIYDYINSVKFLERIIKVGLGFKFHNLSVILFLPQIKTFYRSAQ